MLDLGNYERMVGSTVGPFHVDQIEQDDLGPLFLCHHESDAGVFRLRLFPPPTALDPATYMERLDHQARHLATLRHPYILPMVQFGGFHTGAFVAHPQPPGRSLTTRIRRSGPIDPITTGRYLDQIAGALEYAHERNTLHRHLTTDSLLLQMDGQVAVADFGVRRMLELGERPGQAQALRYVRGSCAPEQLNGGTVERPADVYALGTVLYFLLTGHPVFSGNSPEQLADQHLHAPVPSLATWRPGLPPELDAMLAAAMAKDPAERFASPGALANAYHRIISPNNSARVPFIAAQPSVPSFASAASPFGGSIASNPSGVGRSNGNGLQSLPLGIDRTSPNSGKVGTSNRPPKRGGRGWISLLVAVVLIAVTIGGAFQLHLVGGSTPAAVALTGQATFMDGSPTDVGDSNALKLVIHGLPTPDAGSAYYAWLIDTKAEHVTSLGQLKGQDGTYSLNYVSDASATSANLVGAGTQIQVTLEKGDATVPVGRIVLAGTFPPEAFVHIQHLLVAFPATPNHIGLIVGAIRQIQLLKTQMLALQSAASSGDQERVTCAAQSLINILEGSKGAHYVPLAAPCSTTKGAAGDGFGLLGPQADGTGEGYISDASAHTTFAITTPDATANMRQHAAGVERALSNVLGWALSIRADAVKILQAPADTTVVTEMATLVQNAYTGVSVNGALQEGGVLTAFAEAQQMASLTLTAHS